ncbi:MAG TPA: hypothetical protein VGM44_07295 [Polyangiaceae bacterium]
MLTHLRDPAKVVRAWARAALPGARLVLEETELRAEDMTELHAMNLGTWSNDSFAKANYDRDELRELEQTLGRIASGEVSARPIMLGMGQVVLRRA